MHKYAYVHGDPIQGIDPTGLFTIAGISVGTAIRVSLRGAKLAGVAGFYFGTADSLLGGKSLTKSIEDGAHTAVFAAAIGGLLAPVYSDN